MDSFLSQKNLNLFKNAVGRNSLKYFYKSNTFFSSLIYAESFEKLLFQNGNLILKNFSGPFIEDWKIYLIIRSHCKTWITTGKMLRDEKDLNTYHDFEFFDCVDIENYFYGIENEEKSEIYKTNHGRNGIIFSNNFKIEDLQTLKFFKLKSFKKYIIENEKLKNEIHLYGEEKFKEFSEENKIFLISKKFQNIKEILKYSREELLIKDNILLEIGTSTMQNFFNDVKKNNPIDFMLLSVYQGEINKESIGDKFTSIEDLKRSGLVLINISNQINSEKGFLNFYTFVHEKILNL